MSDKGVSVRIPRFGKSSKRQAIADRSVRATPVALGESSWVGWVSATACDEKVCGSAEVLRYARLSPRSSQDGNVRLVAGIFAEQRRSRDDEQQRPQHAQQC